MTLDRRDQLVSLVSGALAAYSVRRDADLLPSGITPYGFVLRVVPGDMRSELTAELIDEIFEYVSGRLAAHSPQAGSREAPL